ncbi:MAG: hypothetical protein ACYDG4_15205 [Desulfuromonadaceae bacterium]
MSAPGNAKNFPYNVKFKGLLAEKFYMPDGSGSYDEVTALAAELNTLNLISRKFTIYSAVALALGELLHISGYNVAGDVFTVEKADADGKPAQLIAAAANAGGVTSLADDIQELTGLDTDAGVVGDPVYLSAATAGGWALTAPTTSSGVVPIKQIVGRIKAKSATLGKIVFNTVKCEIVPPTNSRGSSTGTGSEQTIAHGLGGAPQAVNVVATGSNSFAAAVRADATNIYVTVPDDEPYTWSAVGV